LGTGHTNDFVVTTPCFHRGRLVGLFSCTSHILDIGGARTFVEPRDVFMEGLYIPILKLIDAGILNEGVMAMIRANTRTPIDTEGDTYSLVACNAVGCDRLVEMMDEFDLENLDELGTHIIETSRAAVLAEIALLPHGTWRNEMTVDGYDTPIILKAALTVSASGIHIDFSGSSAMVPYSINVPICYTLAYTTFGLGCVVARGIPNNFGSLAPLTVSAPPGCILNATKPAAVNSRSSIGMMMPDLAYGCLRQAVPERVLAEGASSLWGLRVSGPRHSPPRHGAEFRAQVITTGGMGALPARDGLSATGFPSGVRGGPVEVFESLSTVIVWRKEFRADSGGAGATRGGLGQIIEIENGLSEPFVFHASFERTVFPARGFFGGAEGGIGSVSLSTGQRLGGRGAHQIPAGARVIIRSPGGGGLGDPRRRDPALIAADLANGLISADAAETIYGAGALAAAAQ
jgi:N-methylhydantoinase B